MLVSVSVLSLHLIGMVYGIEVTPYSPCASLCVNIPNSNIASVNSSWTLPVDLVCNDWELDGPNSTSIGRIFHDCVQCQVHSTAYDAKSNENDQYWFLCKSPTRSREPRLPYLHGTVNTKFTLDHCLFNFQNENATIQSKQCGNVCKGPSGAMQQALVDRVLQTNATLQYQYCNNGDNAFNKTVDSCKDCLQHVSSSNVLINCARPRLSLLLILLTESASDLRVLQEACQQRPKIGGDTPVRLSFDLYNTTSLPSSTSTIPAKITVISSTTVLASHSNPRAIKLGISIGIGLGIPFCILAATLLFCYRRRHHQHKIEKEAQLREERKAEYHGQVQEENKARHASLTEMMVPIEQIVAEKDGQQAPRVPKDCPQSSLRGYPAEMDAKQRGAELSADGTSQNTLVRNPSSPRSGR